MPRKAQGWITFQASEEERQILEQICQQTQRTKTEVLREMLRQAAPSVVPALAAEPPQAEETTASGEQAIAPTSLPAPASVPPSNLQISARNILQATVKSILWSTVNVEVTLAIAPEVELVAVITRASADHLGLQPGKPVFAVIKSTSVMVAQR